MEFYRQAQISHHSTAVSHSHYIFIAYSAAHTSPGCVHSNSCQMSSSGGISDDPCRALHSNAAQPRHTCAAYY